MRAGGETPRPVCGVIDSRSEPYHLVAGVGLVIIAEPGVHDGQVDPPVRTKADVDRQARVPKEDADARLCGDVPRRRSADAAMQADPQTDAVETDARARREARYERERREDEERVEAEVTI